MTLVDYRSTLGYNSYVRTFELTVTYSKTANLVIEEDVSEVEAAPDETTVIELTVEEKQEQV